jgi:small subunit ribosomal protein S3
MGHKVPPTGLRIGVTEPWRSRWYAQKKNYGQWLIQDQRIRNFIRKEYASAGISRIEIERIGEKVQVIIYAARPGLIIGKRGAKIDQLIADVSALSDGSIEISIKESQTPELDATIVAQAVAEQLERRAPHRRIMRRYIDMIMETGAKGVKIQVKGRLGGAEIARGDFMVVGKLPLHTLKADIDYGTATAILTKGTIGVKVWIYKGEKAGHPQPGPPAGSQEEVG